MRRVLVLAVLSVVVASPCYAVEGDVNRDGTVNLTDFLLLVGNWGKVGEPGVPVQDTIRVVETVVETITVADTITVTTYDTTRVTVTRTLYDTTFVTAEVCPPLSGDLPYVVAETVTTRADYKGDWEGFGEVYNGQSFAIYLVQVNVTLRDADRKIIDVDFTYVAGNANPDDHLSYIGPGGKSSFDLRASVPLEDVASYEFSVTYYVAD